MKAEYRQIDAALMDFLQVEDGFIIIGRFQILSEEGGIFSLSLYGKRKPSTVAQAAGSALGQQKGKEPLFRDRRCRIAEVIRLNPFLMETPRSASGCGLGEVDVRWADSCTFRP